MIISEEKLNRYIDRQLDKVEMEQVNRAIKKDTELVKRYWAIIETRNLVKYSYENVPLSQPEKKVLTLGNTIFRVFFMILIIALISFGGLFTL